MEWTTLIHERSCWERKNTRTCVRTYGVDERKSRCLMCTVSSLIFYSLHSLPIILILDLKNNFRNKLGCKNVQLRFQTEARDRLQSWLFLPAYTFSCLQVLVLQISWSQTIQCGPPSPPNDSGRYSFDRCMTREFGIYPKTQWIMPRKWEQEQVYEEFSWPKG